jgi:uncharacterized protein
MKMLIIAAVGALLAVPAYAQDSKYGPLEPTPAGMAHARHLFAVMHIDTMMGQMTEQMMSTMMKSSLANLPADKQKAGHAMQASMVEDMKLMFPKVRDAMVQIYARNLTEQELADIDAFYSSPSGQAVVTKLPQLTARIMPFVLAQMPDIMRHAFDRFCSETTCTAQDRASMERAVQSLEARAASAS